MRQEQQEIEVEVVEIDGVATAPPAKGYSDPHHDPYSTGTSGGWAWQDWQKWPGRVRQLDMRWWPLWLFLGIIALFLLVTIGLVAAAIFLLIKIAQIIFRGLSR
ncbi:hypothetical protein JIN85_01615 [Luteolibacter pohnpeiensis]|uniref:Uncharacterized protein n=1 Tax=Luteolibacter pohnpeiensis TaxID=454153 RepID=A0A934VUF5_9BACT|nr:hypothetical protein [Luteolibacter pohnpeiensis]MBK1881090.1 hypothetical protein [Luteolibacter pohnpeiensis]